MTEQPVSGPWPRRQTVFAEAAALLDRYLSRLIATSSRGDGFDPMGLEIPVVSWESLALKLPARPAADAGEQIRGVELVSAWVVDVQIQTDHPPVQFQFPAPLQMHSGRVAKLTGDVAFAKDLGISSASGKFQVAVADLTMGDHDLDRDVQQNMLQAGDYPTSHFAFTSIRSKRGPLVIGQPIPATLDGEFMMKGIGIPLDVPVTLEVFVGQDGRPRLSIDGRWQLRLQDPFGLTGPDGPQPANDTLVFRCHIVLQPALPR